MTLMTGISTLPHCANKVLGAVPRLQFWEPGLCMGTAELDHNCRANGIGSVPELG